VIEPADMQNTYNFWKVTDGDDNIDFNVSHHGDWVVLAACTNGKIGVDVTRRDVPKEDVDSFVNYFTDQVCLIN
jgi:phosphopantetheinyl transferase